MNNTTMKFPWNQGESPTKFFERSFTNSDLNIINYFLYLQNKYLTIYVSQQTIAKDIGITRKTVQRALEKLECHNLVTRMNRGAHKTCLYEISPLFRIPEVRWQLSSRFTALRKLCIAFLLSSFSSQLANVPEFVNNNLLNIKRSDRYSIINNLLLSKEGKSNKKKRCWKRYGSVMYEAKGEDPSVLFSSFSPALENFKSLKLTDAGKVHLCIFPDSVIKAVDERLSKRSAVKDPIGYIFGTCLKICKEKRYKLAILLRERYIKTMGIKYGDNFQFYDASSYKVASTTPTPPQKFYNSNKDNSQFNANHAAMSEREKKKVPLSDEERYEKLKKKVEDPIAMKNLLMYSGSDDIIKEFKELEKNIIQQRMNRE